MQQLAASDPSLGKLDPSHESTGIVQMRIKTLSNTHDRSSQSKSMVYAENLKVVEPLSRHRRNHSQHNIPHLDCLVPLEKQIIKEGYLLKAKIADEGKKLRKNWTFSRIVLTGRKMEFYKESKQPAVPNLKGPKPEWLDLCGAQIEWTKEKSSKKNVFQPKEKSYILKNNELKIQRSSSSELLGVHANSKEPKTENRRSLIFRLNYSKSDTNDRSQVKSRLKKFITRRPSLKTLQEKGIIKDQIFGAYLHNVCERDGSTVPHFVKMCIKAVEERGLDVDGIYRVSGNLATIQKLRFVVNQEEKLNLDDSQWEDIHVVTGALKMFFRELPEPLFPYCFFEQFVEAIKIQEHDSQVKAIKDLVQRLPRPNYDTMNLVFAHLQKIAAKENMNLMSPQSLGIVFGPTLLRPEKETGSMAIHMLYQNQLIELMLTEYTKIFSSD
ncbi:rho GTPase-activating protein 15 isoform X2 [Ahaetulla prasina]|uniref:rho GTPase-activating protein 15 isoform X2 n=1 Tax=Ahaetulla prasina TaxID=499056 RepID=UPI0026486C72|nr:rho GTPase-activating protein 15 isoform X2 [Ahaetulla prasina]